MSKPEGHDEAVKRAVFLPSRISDAHAFECFVPAPPVQFGRKYLLHVLFPVFAATYIYTLWGSHSFIVFKWYEEAGLGSIVTLLRRAGRPLRPFIPSFLLFSVPAALWLYAVTAVCLLVWAQRKARINWLWIMLPFTLAVASEIGQRFHIVPGTFDVLDLLAYATAAIAAYTLLGKPMRNFGRR